MTRSIIRRATPLIAAAVALLVCLCTPLDARAGTYSVWSCHTPIGGFASTEGWQDAGVSTSVGSTRTTDDCQKAGRPYAAGQLNAQVRENFRDFARVSDHASWSFGAPAGTLIQDARIGLCASADIGGKIAIGPSGDWTAPGTTLVPQGIGYGTRLGCGEAPYWSTAITTGTNYVDRDGLNVSRLWFSAWCIQEDCSNDSTPYASVSIAAARFVLRDDHAPTVARAAGSLANGAGDGGRFSASFDAGDIGGGLYRTVTDVKVNQSGDWKQLSADVIDRLGGRCAPAGVSGALYEFVYPTPCRSAVADARVTLDTSTLPPGDHLVRAQVEDVAGNRTDIVAPRIVHVDEPARSRPLGGVLPPVLTPNNGSGASARALVRLARAERTVRYRAKVNVSGRLVDESNRAIAGATIQVDARRLIPGRGLKGVAWKPLGKVTTDRAGRFVARVPAEMSRALRFSYRANVSQDGFTSAAQFGLNVRAYITLRAARTRIRNGQTAIFSGRVAGTPPGGVPLSLQAFVAGRGWTPARTEKPNPQTNARGRYHVAYRFARTYQRVVYRFRVVVGEDSAFPFVRSASRSVKVVVRP